MASSPRRTPKDRIADEVAARGQEAFIAGCFAILQGSDEEPVLSDLALIDVLGGPHAWLVMESGPRPDQAYWLRVWAMRGLLWAYDPDAGETNSRNAVIRGLADTAWRVREMAAKVCARHAIQQAMPELERCRESDANSRVRTAAARASQVLANQTAQTSQENSANQTSPNKPSLTD